MQANLRRLDKIPEMRSNEEAIGWLGERDILTPHSLGTLWRPANRSCPVMLIKRWQYSTILAGCLKDGRYGVLKDGRLVNANGNCLSTLESFERGEQMLQWLYLGTRGCFSESKSGGALYTHSDGSKIRVEETFAYGTLVDIACVREYRYGIMKDGTLRRAPQISLDTLPYLKKGDIVLQWLCPPALDNYMLQPDGGAVLVRPTGGKVVSVSNANYVDIVEACRYKGRYALSADGSLRQEWESNISWCPFDAERENELWNTVIKARERTMRGKARARVRRASSDTSVSSTSVDSCWSRSVDTDEDTASTSSRPATPCKVQ